jgi:hypothetical protein
LALALAALAPRAAGAFLRRPWHDEYFTAWASKLPLADLVAALRLDSGPPLPYLLVKLFASVGSDPIAAARAISVAAGTAAVLIAALASRRAFGDRAGWWTGALLAVHPLAVAWSCEGRAYALVLLAAAWAWERMEAMSSNGRGAVGLAFAVALACWSHGLGMLLAAVLAAAALTLRLPVRGRALSAVGVGIASHLPWLPIALHQPPAAVAWMSVSWQAMPIPDRVTAPLRMLSPLADFATALDLPSSTGVLEVAAAMALIVLVVAGCLTRGAFRFAIGFILPTAALGALAALGVPAFYPGRGEVLAMVPLLALVGAAAGSRRPAALAGLALVCAGAVTVARAEAAWAHAPARGEQRIAETLRQSMPHGGLVVISGYGRLGIEYHLGSAASGFELVNYPAEAARHPGWYDPFVDRPASDELNQLRQRASSVRIPVAEVVSRGLPTTTDLSRLASSLGLRPALDVEDSIVFVSPGGSALPLRP